MPVRGVVDEVAGREPVRFVRSFGVYCQGDVAFFTPERAEQLRKSGIAVKASAKDVAQGRPPVELPEEERALRPFGPSTCVLFDLSWQGYQIGELAWFPESVADQLTDKRIGHRPTQVELDKIAEARVKRVEAQALVPVRLLKQVHPNNRDEVIWVQQSTADMYVAKKIAVAVTVPEAEATVTDGEKKRKSA